jgi:hypothetical protein
VKLLAAAALPLLLASPSASRKTAPAPQEAGCSVTFTDVAAQAGLRFTHDSGPTPEHRQPESMGSGLAWLDYDNDGWMDLYVVQSGPYPPNGSARARDRLFHNNRDGTFTDVTEKAGLHDTAYGMGVVAADYDNDGFTDLYVTNVGGNILYHNNGDGTFTDVTARAGVAASGWCTSAAFADFDGDGLLDLIVLRYLDYDPTRDFFCGAPGYRDYCDPQLFGPTRDILFHNNGDGTFTDISESSGIAGPEGKGLGVVVSDLDGDGRPDIYVANDTVTNFLFRNLGNNRFEDISVVSGAAVNSTGMPSGGMGVAAGDMDGDGLMDLLVANYQREINSYFHNLGSAVFEDISATSGFGGQSFTFSGFGLNLLDADNSGRLDVFIANGHVLDRPTLHGSTHAERPFLMWNDGSGHFTERGCGAPFRKPVVARGSAVADYDNDGDLDIAVSVWNGKLELLRNDGRHGPWIGIQLKGTRSNRQGIGARLTLETELGRQVRELHAGDSYLSSSDPRILFGLGNAKTIRQLEIRWPSGTVQVVKDLKPGRYQTVVESVGE